MSETARTARRLRLSLLLVPWVGAGCMLVAGVDFDAARRAPLDGSLPSVEADTDASAPPPATDLEAGRRNACPTGRGPDMIQLDPKHCIDSTEVTVAQYRAFLGVLSDAGLPQPAECAWNTTFEPGSPLPDATMDDFPVGWLNWCQARGYCAWAGKSLCGAFDGGAIVEDGGSQDPAVSVWMSACSAGGRQPYPYGSTLDETACNLAPPDGAAAPLAAVTSFPRCVGSLPGLLDMLGNAKEWEDSCASSEEDAAADTCRTRGGSSNWSADMVTCAFEEDVPRSGWGYRTGVRCCATLP